MWCKSVAPRFRVFHDPHRLPMDGMAAPRLQSHVHPSFHGAVSLIRWLEPTAQQQRLPYLGHVYQYNKFVISALSSRVVWNTLLARDCPRIGVVPTVTSSSRCMGFRNSGPVFTVRSMEVCASLETRFDTPRVV